MSRVGEARGAAGKGRRGLEVRPSLVSSDISARVILPFISFFAATAILRRSAYLL